MFMTDPVQAVRITALETRVALLEARPSASDQSAEVFVRELLESLRELGVAAPGNDVH